MMQCTVTKYRTYQDCTISALQNNYKSALGGVVSSKNPIRMSSTLFQNNDLFLLYSRRSEETKLGSSPPPRRKNVLFLATKKTLV
jgi:hypothetical protein